MDGTSTALRTARLWQPLVCFGLLASIGLSVMAIEWAIHSEAFGADGPRVVQGERDRQRIQAAIPGHRGPHRAARSGRSRRFAGRRLFLRRLEHEMVDARAGPAARRAKTRPRLRRRRRVALFPPAIPRGYLVKHKKLLQAGPEKTLIVFGASFINAKAIDDGPTTFFPNLWRRYGLYRYDFGKGIEPVSHGSLLDAYYLEKARCSSFVQGMIDKAGRMAVPRALRRRKTEKDPAAFTADYKRRMGPHWEADIRQHGRELQEWFDYVHGQGMNFAVVLLPLASWHGPPLPYPPKYRAEIAAFCKRNHNPDGQAVPLYDLTSIAGDDDFADHIHMNASGLPKTDAALMEIARKFLKKTGAWPGR